VTDIPRTSSPDEREFWDDQFRDERRAARRGAGPSPRAPRRPVASDRPFDRVVDRLLDRVRDWRADARFGVVVLVLVALVAGGVWYRLGVGGASAGEPAPMRARRPTTTTAARGSSESSASAGSPAGAANAKGSTSTIAVHVAGAVTHPGVVELPGDLG